MKIVYSITMVKMPLNLCTAFKLCILNGMCKGDHDGCYTYISDNGSSVNDYFLISYDQLDEISDICKFVVHDRIDSDHMPVTLHLSLKYNMLHYKLSAAERTVTRRAICLIISCCGF